MRTVCIWCPELSAARQAAEARFKAAALSVEFVMGIHGEQFGVVGIRPYKPDGPKHGQLMGFEQSGLFLSHYMLWTAMDLSGEDEWFILEDDAEPIYNFPTEFAFAYRDIPDDADLIFVGSSNTADKPKSRIKGAIWEVRWPFCTHAYIVRRKALSILLADMRDAYTKIDIALQERVFKKLKVYTVLPRLVTQLKTPLAE